MMLLAVCLLGSGLIGCARNRFPLNVIDGKDIVPLKAGQTFTPDRDGCFYSLQAEDEIMNIYHAEAQ